mgnify:CR=1 FL=1
MCSFSYTLVRDVDGDGRVDLFCVDYELTDFWFLPGNGDGTFGTGQRIPKGTWWWARAIGEFDGRPGLELVGKKAERTLAVWTDLAAPSPREIFSYEVARRGFEAFALDVDGDGLDDLCIHSWPIGEGPPKDLTLVRSLGEGSFGDPVRYDMVPGMRLDGFGVFERDRDGGARTVLGTSAGHASLWAFDHENRRMRALESAWIPASYPPFGADSGACLQPADVDGDGHTDLVALARAGTVICYFRNEHGFRDVARPLPELDVQDVAGAPGVPEILVLANCQNSLCDVGACATAAQGAIAPPKKLTRIGVPNRPDTDWTSPFEAGDLNGDGRLDLAILSGWEYAIAVQDAEGGFVPVDTSALPAYPFYVEASEVVDFDRDGKDDIVFHAHRYEPPKTSTFVYALRGDRLEKILEHEAPFHKGGIAVSDLDGDGHSDIAVASGETRLSILYTEGTRVAQVVTLDPRLPPAGVLMVAGIETGDFDGDGRGDVVCAWWRGGLTAFFGAGGRTFSAPRQFLKGYAFSSAWFRTSDLNRDGKDDIFGAIFAVAATGEFSEDHLFTLWGAEGSAALKDAHIVRNAEVNPVLGSLLRDLDGDALPDLILPTLDVLWNRAAARLPEGSFIRGDANRDGAVRFEDLLHMLGYLFLGTAPGECTDAFDANDTGDLNVVDVVFLARYLFSVPGYPPPPPPYPEPGPDPTDDELTCP